MNPFLAALLGQSSAPIMGQDPNDLLMEDNVTEGEPIVVDMPRSAPPAPEASTPAPVTPVNSDAPPGMYDGMGLDNSDALRQAYLINQRNDQMAQKGDPERGIEPRKGMFGMKGALRDIVGVLGDAFLVQSGNKAVYGPRRDQERFADSMAGFTRNPGAAVERAMATGIDNKGAYEIYDREGNRINDANRTRVQAVESDRKLFNDTSALASQMMAAAVTTGTPQAIEQAKQGIQVLSQRTGIPVEQLMAGEDPALIAGRGMTGYQNFRLPQQERALDLQKEALNIRLRGVKDQEARTRILEDAFGLKRDTQQFNNMMDMFGLNQDVIEEVGRNRRDANNANNRSSPSEGNSNGGWVIKPAGK
jgi:hypothetical protein